MKTINDLGDIETSISDTLENHREIVVPLGVAQFFWESRDELEWWTRSRNATVARRDDGAFILKKDAA